MRVALALFLVLALAGCDDAFDLPSFNGPAATFPGPPAAPLDPRCQAVAADRMADVALQGFDEDVQRETYERTYADCVAWAARRTNED
jgi:hypothetical protein